MRNPRALIAAGVLTLAVVVSVVILAVSGEQSDRDEPRPTVRAELTLEQFTLPDTGRVELLISLRKVRLNTLEVTGGETSIRLLCVDEGDAVVLRRRTEWPLLEEQGYPFPHIHQPVDRRLLGTIRGCRLIGPGIDFEGRAQGGLPVAAQ